MFKDFASLPGAAIAVIITTWFTLAQAQEMPIVPEIQGYISTNLPNYFQLENLTLGPPSESGPPDRRRLVYRFDAQLSAKVSLYAPTREEGPFVLLIGTVAEDGVVHATGMLDLSWNGTAWSAGVSLDQDLTKFGLPINRFGQPALVAGEAETRAKLALITSEIEASAISAARETLEAQLAALKASGDASQDIERKAAEAEIAEEKKKNAAAMLDLIAQHASDMADAKLKNAAELEDLNTKHATERGNLIAAQRTDIAELETSLATQQESLVKQVQSAEMTIRLQEKLAADLQTVTANFAESLANFSTMRKSRIDFLQTLPDVWSGTVDCVNGTGNTAVVESFPVVFELSEATSNGFGVRALLSHSNVGEGKVAILDGNLTFPLQLHFAFERLAQGKLPQQFDLTLSTVDGIMSGKQFIVYENGPTRTCSFSLSS